MLLASGVTPYRVVNGGRCVLRTAPTAEQPRWCGARFYRECQGRPRRTLTNLPPSPFSRVTRSISIVDGTCLSRRAPVAISAPMALRGRVLPPHHRGLSRVGAVFETRALSLTAMQGVTPEKKSIVNSFPTRRGKAPHRQVGKGNSQKPWVFEPHFLASFLGGSKKEARRRSGETNPSQGPPQSKI